MPVTKRSKAGTWIIRLDLPVAPGSKRQQVRLHAKTRAELNAKMASALAEFEKHGPPPRTKTTVSELLDRWLEKKSHEVEFRTIESYRDQVRLYLKPRFGDRIVYHLTTAEVQAAIDDWQKAERYDKKQGKRSARTISYPITVLSSALKYGKALGLCRDNVALYVQRPRKEQRQPPVVDAERAVVILRALLQTALFTPIWVAFCAGLRRGELVGLRRQDVDVTKRILHIERAVVCRKSCIIVKATKRPKSERSLPMSEITARILAVYLEQQDHRLSLLGVTCTDDTPLFDDGEGRLWNPDSFGSAYAREVSKLHESRLRLHGARHSFASIALEEGVQLLVISDVLGHESKAFTAQYYAHVLPNTLKDAMERVSEALVRHLGFVDLPHSARDGTDSPDTPTAVADGVRQWTPVESLPSVSNV